MDIRRITAIMYRHLRPTLRDPMRLLDMFYWPLLDIVLWGFTAVWLGRMNSENPHAAAMLLTSLVLWQVVFRSSIEVTRNMLEELWHQNLINLFASPLKLSEWLTAILAISLINSTWNLLFGALMVKLFFSISVLNLGLHLITYFFMLMLFGWFCGLIAASAILSFGRRVEMIAWSFPWFFSTFSCVFYPISVLPAWVQKICWLLPSTYVFENARAQIAMNTINAEMLATGITLAVAFFLFGVGLLSYRFKRARARGLNSLE